jgi:hypothetical protein
MDFWCVMVKAGPVIGVQNSGKRLEKNPFSKISIACACNSKELRTIDLLGCTFKASIGKSFARGKKSLRRLHKYRMAAS